MMLAICFLLHHLINLISTPSEYFTCMGDAFDICTHWSIALEKNI